MNRSLLISRRGLSAALCLLLPSWAAARFVQPYEIAKDSPAKAAMAELRKIKNAKEADGPFKEIKAAADAGDAEALFALGYLFQTGLGTEMAADKAKESYQKAVDKGVLAAKNNLGLLQLATGGDAKAAIGMVEEAAGAAYPPAMVSMGQLFLDGMPAAGITKDADQARVWFERAADAGDDGALLTLGIMYQSGAGVSADQAKSIDLLQKSADKGNSEAMIRLGARLVSGQGVKADPDKGRALFEKAIKEGAAGAKVTLAAIYETGTGVTKDYKKAFDLYTEAANEGHFDSFNKLAFFHENGQGVPKDESKAAEWYKKGAEKKVSVCIHNLAVFTEEGKGGVKKDEAEAFQLFYKAALQAFVPSQLALATRYREGRGVLADPQAALAWFERAMQNGDADGAVQYTAMMENGAAGIMNQEIAAKIYNELANKGHGPAMIGLAGMMLDGRGGYPSDFRPAYFLLQIASSGGYKPAGERLEALKKKMSPEQIKAAEEYVAKSLGKPVPAPPATGSGTTAPAPPGPAGTAEPKPKPTTPKPAESPPKPAPKPPRPRTPR